MGQVGYVIIDALIELYCYVGAFSLNNAHPDTL